MSWLRDLFHKFVFPAFLAAEENTKELGAPFDIRPALCSPEKLPTELKKLWTLCQEYKVSWVYDVREINTTCGTSKFRESARIHGDILRKTLDSAQVAMREEKCKRLFLGGRDVWCFAILCERRQIPYLFIPELSRSVASNPISKSFLEARGLREDDLFVDTGFVGSIPRLVSKHFGQEFKYRLMSQSNQLMFTTKKHSGKDLRPNQLFPNRKMARAEAIETEYLSKFWSSGEVISKVPVVRENGIMKFVGGLESKPNTHRWGKIEPGPKNKFGFIDGNEIVRISIENIQSLPWFPWFHDIWKSLPERNVDDLDLDDQIIQRFSDRASIQRAALLTSQLWRGIPYWKHIPSSPTGPKPQPSILSYTSFANTSGINNASTLSHVMNTQFSINSNVITTTTVI